MGATDGHDDAGDERFLASLDHVVADAVAFEAGRERSQVRVLGDVASQEATFVGVCVDLAERGGVVSVRTSSGRAFRGRVLAVGRDFVVVRDGMAPPVFVAVASITSVRPQPRSGSGGGAVASATGGGRRVAPVNAGLAAVLAGLAAERPRVQVGVAGGEPVAGQLRSVGVDVVTVVLDGDGGLRAFVPLDAIAELVLFDL